MFCLGCDQKLPRKEGYHLGQGHFFCSAKCFVDYIQRRSARELIQRILTEMREP